MYWPLMLLRRMRGRLGACVVLCCVATPALGQDQTVSRSRGKPDGIVVLWPRVVPETSDESIQKLARSLQRRLASIAATVVPERRLIDVRPASERVCPAYRGCKAPSVGLVLGHQDGGCAVVALVSAPGESPQRLVPWAGDFNFEEGAVPFRSPPEDAITVTELVPCALLRKEIRNEVVELPLRQALKE